MYFFLSSIVPFVAPIKIEIVLNLNTSRNAVPLLSLRMMIGWEGKNRVERILKRVLNVRANHRLT